MKPVASLEDRTKNELNYYVNCFENNLSETKISLEKVKTNRQVHFCFIKTFSILFDLKTENIKILFATIIIFIHEFTENHRDLCVLL